MEGGKARYVSDFGEQGRQCVQNNFELPQLDLE